MDYIDYRCLIGKPNSFLPDNYYNFNTRKDGYLNKERRKLKFLCECKNGHHFDYRKRIKYPAEDKTHAPSQGKCPKCGSSFISMWSQMLYPTRFNF